MLRNILLFTTLTLGSLLSSVAGAQEDLTAPGSSNYIPDDLGVAIGAGVAFPSDVLVWNRVSARLRIVGMEIEPYFLFGTSSSTTETQVNAAGTSTDTEDTSSGSALGFGGNVYYPVLGGDNIELQAVGSLLFQNQSYEDDPDGDDNTESGSAREFSVGYGVAIEWWVTRHISFSAIATNRLISSTKTHDEAETGPDSNQEQDVSSSSYGLEWNPTIAGVFSVWFN